MKRYRHYKQDKAIILSCFGSVIEQKQYEKLQKTIQKDFPDTKVFLAFGSRMVLNDLNKTTQKYKNLVQTLADVDMMGYKNIIVASINLFPTDEHQVLKDIVRGFNIFSLANIRYTNAIFTKTKDTTLFLQHLNQTISKKNQANIYIIHGTPKLDTIGIDSITYTQEFLQTLSSHNYTCSLEGSMPFFAIKDVLIKKIKKSKIKKVQIVPMLLVSGNHYINDMVQIKDELNKTFDTKIVPSITQDSKFNLLNIPQIQDIIKINIQEQIIKLGIN